MRAAAGRKRSGFTLIEVMITIVILFVILDAMMLFFLNVMAEYRRQAKITETGIETVIGLEVLRKDIESAGYGLPWNNLPSYSEATGTGLTALNDPSTVAPRAILNSVGTGFNGSDAFVVKSVSVGTDEACRKWTTLRISDAKRTWGDTVSDFAATDQVLVLGTDTDPNIQRNYVTTTTYNATSGFAPASVQAVRLIHGLTDGAVPRMPFNRAEYFIDTSDVPGLCAPGTGVLTKAVIRHDTGDRGPLLPLLDCVRDLQLSFGINEAGTAPTVDCVVAAVVSDNTAAYLRTRLRDVRIRILAHEGAQDKSYTHSEATIFVGDNTLGNAVGATDNMAALLNYRWKVYTIVVRPSSLR